MRDLVSGPWIIGRLRAALLVLVGAAAILDLVTFVALVVGGGDTPDADARLGPDQVARQVIQAVADDDCDDLGDRLADDADLPISVRRCLAGTPSAVALTGVRVESTATDGAASAVTIAVAADGVDSQVLVDLRLDGDRWLVSGVRPT